MIIDSKKTVKVKGTVLETLPGTKFKVGINIKGKEHTVFAYISGRMRMNYIKLLVGDEVDLEISPYDLTKGRITYRY
jgi:translation initiation factor IF-1